MQKDLLSDLVKKPQREVAGPDIASRFDYQKNWAFCQMLRRHMDGADYLVAFEFHDDVVFMEPSGLPTKVDFYQVKTTKSSKPRTLTTLTSKGKKQNSILGKMCLNFHGICQDHDTSVVLVSNVAFQFADKDICADDLDSKYRDKIVSTLTSEISSLTEAHLAKMHFMICGVSIDAMQSFLQGEVSELFKAELGEDHGLNIHSWIRLVQGEIGRKNNFPSENIASAQQLVEKKCVAKAFVTDSIVCVSRERTVPPDMQLINTELSNAAWNTSTLMRIGKQLPTATLDHSDATNKDVADMVEKIVSILENTENENLDKFLVAVEDSFSNTTADLGPYSDKHYLWALAILVYHENI